MGSSAITGISRSPASMRNSRSAATRVRRPATSATFPHRALLGSEVDAPSRLAAAIPRGAQGLWYHAGFLAPPAIGRHGHISGSALDSHHRVLAVVARLGPDGGQDDHRPAIQCSSFAPVGGLVECHLLANVWLVHVGHVRHTAIDRFVAGSSQVAMLRTYSLKISSRDGSALICVPGASVTNDGAPRSRSQL